MLRKILKVELIIIVIVCIAVLLYSHNKVQERIYYENLPALEKTDEGSWYIKNRIIAHGGGGIDGLDYTNSKEAIENTLNNNINIIEIDFELSSDGELICYHEISDVFFPIKESYTLEEFKNQKIQGKYTALSGEDVFKYMEENPELHIVIDTKNSDYLGVVKKIVDNANPELLSRFIVQCYKPGDKKTISEIYQFPDSNYLFTAYKYSDDAYKLLKACMDEEIGVLVVPVLPQLYDNNIMELFNSKNIKVYFHTVNRPDVANFLLEKGAHGIYTDFIFELRKEF